MLKRCRLIGNPLRFLTRAGIVLFAAILLCLGVPQAEACGGCQCCIPIGPGGSKCSFNCNHIGSYTSGELINSDNLPDSGTGYYHHIGGDLPNTDDWACGSYLIARTTQVGQDWNRSPRMGVLDLSRECGGAFPPHSAHENGLEVDVRYVRSDGAEDSCDIDQGCPYDQTGTQQLVNFWINRGASKIFVDDDSGLQGSGVQVLSGHSNHFHVRMPDPDTDPSPPCEPT